MPLELVSPDDHEYARYSANFAAYNKALGGLESETFSIIKRDAENRERIVGGGRGQVYLGALEIRGLWVDPDLRGTGLGHRILCAIEDEARRRGATRSMLFTFSWQAEAFYTAHDYTEYARFEFPEGGARIDMAKDL